MTNTSGEIERLGKALRYDLTAAQGRLTELLNALAEIAPALAQEAKPYTCPRCGLEFKREETRNEHLANVHGKGSP